jgi:hypothetical protein
MQLKERIGFGDLCLSLERSGTSQNLSPILALKTGKESPALPNVLPANVMCPTSLYRPMV